MTNVHIPFIGANWDATQMRRRLVWPLGGVARAGATPGVGGQRWWKRCHYVCMCQLVATQLPDLLQLSAMCSVTQNARSPPGAWRGGDPEGAHEPGPGVVVSA